VGRPVENPFTSPECEEEFVRRGEAMIGLYYRPQPGKRSDFVFDTHHTMSKTQFWAIIYLYYLKEKGLVGNVQGYMNRVQIHFGTEVASDRGAVHRNIFSQNQLEVTLSKSPELKTESQRMQRQRYREQYLFVTALWENQNP